MQGLGQGSGHGLGKRRFDPELKKLVVEASRALALLDADRLEELAVSCQALNRDLKPIDDQEAAELTRQAREAAGEMAVFARVLDATRANLNVMSRLRDLREGRLEYGEAVLRSSQWPSRVTGHGDD